jgi:hypothetical protein
MWIFLSNSFLSIVAHRDNPSLLLVRARHKDDITREFPHAAVSETPSADYRYRAELPRHEVSAAIQAAIEDIGYSNFKDSVVEGARHEAYMQVWRVMSALQHRLHGP